MGRKVTLSAFLSPAKMIVTYVQEYQQKKLHRQTPICRRSFIFGNCLKTRDALLYISPIDRKRKTFQLCSLQQRWNQGKRQINIELEKSRIVFFIANARDSSTSTARTIAAASQDSETWSCIHICDTGKKSRGGNLRTTVQYTLSGFFPVSSLAPTQRRMKKVAHLDTSQRSPALGWAYTGPTEKKIDVPEIITSQFDDYSPAGVSVFPQLKR